MKIGCDIVMGKCLVCKRYFFPGGGGRCPAAGFHKFISCPEHQNGINYIHWLKKTRLIIFREAAMFGGGIGMSELLVVLVIVLIIFGAGKLPEIGKGLGKGIRNFRRSASGMDENEVSSKEHEKELDDRTNKP